jgi:dienelactone hydrolase
VNDSPCIGPEHADLRRQVARFVREDVEPNAPAWDEAGCVPRKMLRRMGRLGWLGLRCAPEHGGAGAVTFYPGCRALLREDFAPDTPLPMLLGEKDGWTPPERCVQLAERTRARQPGAEFAVHVYQESNHGFEGNAPLRLRRDVPNGVSPGGVHAGGNPVAREQALAELDRFLQRVFN